MSSVSAAPISDGHGIPAMLQEALASGAPQAVLAELLGSSHESTALTADSAEATAAAALHLEALLVQGPALDLKQFAKVAHAAQHMMLQPICRPAEEWAKGRHSTLHLLPLHAALLGRCPASAIKTLLQLEPKAAGECIPFMAFEDTVNSSIPLQLAHHVSGPPFDTPRVQPLQIDTTSVSSNNAHSYVQGKGSKRKRCYTSGSAVESQESCGLPPLHLAVLLGAPEQLLVAMLEAHPLAAGIQCQWPMKKGECMDEAGRSKHHQICFCKRPNLLLHILLYNRNVFGDNIIRRVLQAFPQAAKEPDAFGFTPVTLALLCSKPLGAACDELLLDLGKIDKTGFEDLLTTFGICQAGSEQGRSADQFEQSAVDIATIVIEARAALKDLQAGPWASDRVFHRLDRHPQIARLLVDGECLLWWALLHRAPSDVSLQLLTAWPQAVHKRLLSIQPIQLAVACQHGVPIVAAIAKAAPESLASVRNVVRLPAFSHARNINGMSSALYTRLQENSNLLHLGLVCGATEDVLNYLLDLDRSLATKTSKMGRTEFSVQQVDTLFLKVLRRSDLSRHFWTRLRDLDPMGCQATLKMIKDEVTSKGRATSVSASVAADFLATFARTTEVAATNSASQELQTELHRGLQARRSAVARILNKHATPVLQLPMVCCTSLIPTHKANHMVEVVTDNPELLPLPYALLLDCPVAVLEELFVGYPMAAADQSLALSVRMHSVPWKSYDYQAWTSMKHCFPGRLTLFDLFVVKCLKLLCCESGPGACQETQELQGLVSLASAVLDAHPEAACWANRSCSLLECLMTREANTKGMSQMTPLCAHLLKVAPQMVKRANVGGGSLLHLPSKVNGSLGRFILQEALLAYPELASVSDQRGRSPLHKLLEACMKERGRTQRELLLPLRDWDCERLVWAGYLKNCDSPFRRLPRFVIANICSCLGRPSYLLMLLVANPQAVWMNATIEADQTPDVRPCGHCSLAPTILQLLLHDVCSGYDPMVIRYILQKVPAAARIPLFVLGPTIRNGHPQKKHITGFGMLAASQNRNSNRQYVVVLPLTALLMNAAPVAPNLIAFVLGLFPSAAASVGATTRLPLQMLVEKLEASSPKMQSLFSTLLHSTPPFDRRASIDEQVARAAHLGSPVKVEGQEAWILSDHVVSAAYLNEYAFSEVSGLVAGAKHCVLAAVSSKRGAIPEAWRRSFDELRQLQRLLFQGPHKNQDCTLAEGVWVDISRLDVARFSKEVHQPLWQLAATCLRSTAVSVDCLRKVLELRVGELSCKVSLDAGMEPQCLELLLQRPQPDVVALVPQLLQLCPMAASTGLSALACQELGCSPGKPALPLKLALRRGCPEQVLMALVRANPKCLLSASGPLSSHPAAPPTHVVDDPWHQPWSGPGPSTQCDSEKPVQTGAQVVVNSVMLASHPNPFCLSYDDEELNGIDHDEDSRSSGGTDDYDYFRDQAYDDGYGYDSDP